MLMGEYLHSVDDKGRVIMPSKFRDVLEKCIVTKGLDNCLFVYSAEEWKNLEAGIRGLPLSKARDLQRFFFAGASEASVDKQGRILIPGNLREYAMLKRDVAIIGASVRAEIWDVERWKKSNEGLTGDAIALAMDELGF